VTEQPFAKSIRWYSTVESAENLKISVLAVVESICAVSLSLWLAWHFQSYSHIVVAIVLAPLLLLRTEESTRLGLKWFGGFFEWLMGFLEWFGKLFSTEDEQLDRNRTGLLFSAIGLIVLATVLWFMVSFWIWLIFVLASLIILGYVFAVESKLLNEPKGVFLIVGIDGVFLTAELVGVVGIGGGVVVVSSLIVKFTATTLTFFRHPLISLQAIPKNWYRIVLATDMRHPPELLPGVESQQYRSLIMEFDHLRYYKLLGTMTNENNYFLKISFGIITLIFLPALLYRWSLKSSALFYLPFLWIIGTPRSIEEFKANIDEQIDLLKNSSFAIIRFRIILFLMIFTTLLPLCLRILIYYSHILPNNWHIWIDGIAAFVGTFETVQWGTWHVTNFLAQVIIIWMWFYLEKLETQRKHRKEVGIHDGKAEFVFLLMRCNQVFFAFTMIYQVYIMMPYL